MAKAKSDGNGSHASVETPAPAAVHEEAAVAPAEGEHEQNDMVATVATVAVVGIGAVAFESALLPGIVLGVAAMWLPKYFPRMGETINPLLRSTVRGAYKLSHKAREVMAEAQEQFHDIAAEVHAEGGSAPTGPNTAAR